MDTSASAKEIESYVIRLRRYFHENPEVGGQEERTKQIIIEELESLGIATEVVKNGGIIGILEGDNPGKTLILRADIDALPMKEAETNLKGVKSCISRNDNAAHMCGHDGHTAMLLGSVKILAQNKKQIRGKIIFAFEQGEENGFGIHAILNRLLEIGADGIWGIHLQSGIPSGKISVDAGPRMASSIYLSIKIKGKGGHGSRPDLACSPLDCFMDIYQKLMMMRLKYLNPFDPLTISIGKVQMGTRANIIPEELIFAGTIRFLNYKDSGALAAEQVVRIIEKACEMYDCTYEYLDRKPIAADALVYNNEDCAKIASEAVKKALGGEAIHNSNAWMASDTMAVYIKYFPGVYAFLGTANKEKGTGAGHHNPHFDLDEDVFKLGVASTVQYALGFLNSNVPIRFSAYKKDLDELLKEIGLQ